MVEATMTDSSKPDVPEKEEGKAPTEFPDLNEDLTYTSVVTEELEVMGTEDMELFEKVRSETTKTIIGTHNGRFHCDEVLACAMLL